MPQNPLPAAFSSLRIGGRVCVDTDIPGGGTVQVTPADAGRTIFCRMSVPRSVTFLLPPTPPQGFTVTIVDDLGDASVNGLYIQSTGNTEFNGVPSSEGPLLWMPDDYGEACVIFSGAGWRILAPRG